MCPHTAIGYGGLKYYLNEGAVGIFLSTAHPVKFKDIVDPLISEKVKVPLRLEKIINKEKKAISMSNRFEDFKEYLIAKN